MNAEILEKIEAYLDGKISREELQQLADAEGVEDLEAEIRWFRDSRTAIEAAGLRRQLDTILPKAEVKTARVRRLRPAYWILAAAASVLLVLAIYWGRQAGTPDLYAEYEYVDPGLPVLMSQSDEHQLYDALTYYGEANYAVAAEKLQNIREQYAQSDTLNYYLGASLLYQGATEEATPYLQQVRDMQGSRYRQRAEWLLVLTALRENELASAKTRLETLVQTPDHEFYQQARELQDELQQ